MGFYLGKTKLASPRVARRRSQGHLLALDHCVARHQSPYDRRGGWYEQAENRQDYEALEHGKS